MAPTLEEDLELAQELADAADAITRSRFRAADLIVETKPDMTPVSEADHLVEETIRRMLAGARPDDAVVGEEFPDTGGASGREWIVDPIDGTKGYVRGIPVYATLIALRSDDDLVLGLASAPPLGRRWWATRGAVRSATVSRSASRASARSRTRTSPTTASRRSMPPDSPPSSSR